MRATPEQKRGSAAALATAILDVGEALPGHRNELLSICIWKWTEAHGKYRGCRYWSRAALEAGDVRLLAHEHVVPRRQLVRALVDDGVAVPDLLARMGIACVVTREEHLRLPEVGWGELVANPWARYSDVEVVDTWAA